MHFPGQKDGEQVLMIIRRHWSVLIGQVCVLIFATCIPVVAYVLLQSRTTIIVDHASLTWALLMMGGSLYLLFVLLFFFTAWIDYYLDIWVVTHDRIIAIEQRGLFSRIVSELTLDRVQDVTSNVHGMFATMLKFGDIRIQTAGEQSQFVFRNIPHPYETARKVMELHQKMMPATAEQPVTPVAAETGTSENDSTHSSAP
ncbi:MAG: PH domain-containing protein [Patescibacteria group bacterium]|jgi:uncharacterized membrane protein YdbT with pleckstrin-like domain